MTTSRSSILAVTSELPWPLNSGGHLRTYHMLRSLAARHRVRLVAPVKSVDAEVIGGLTGVGLDVRPALLGTLPLLGQWRRVAAAFVERKPYVMFRRHCHPAVKRTIVQEVARENPDVYYLDHLDSYQFAARQSATPRLIDLHNVYSRLVARTAEGSSSLLLRRYLAREARLLAAAERQMANDVECLLTVSSMEQSYFRGIGGRDVRLAPNGVDCELYRDLPIGRVAVSAPVVLFVGALSWAPNLDAARFLAQEVLPQVRRVHPQARLEIVGRQPPPAARELERLEGVCLFADVPDVRPFLARASLLAVPLDAGGGTRLKILEAFAAGLPVVSTKVGCEGIDAANAREIVVAERPRFAAAICGVLNDRERATFMAARARALAERAYDWSAIGQVACQAVEGLSPPSTTRSP